jgi:hypothetical protein
MITSIFLLLLLPAWLAEAGELVFVDVSSDDKIDLSTLDVEVAYSRGINNIFASDPMHTHDWADLSDIRKNLGAVFSLEQQISGPAIFRELEADLLATYRGLPKNSEGLLDRDAARYALYRYFDRKHGWQLKGVEPAGGAWLGTIEMDPSVKQTSKYMVPTVLIDDVLEKMGTGGVNVHQLAIVAVTVEHAIRSELLLYLYKIYKTLDLPLEGKKVDAQVKDILSTYLMIYAFGVNLDVSTHGDIQRAKEQLDKKHSWWHDLQNFMAEELRVDAAERGSTRGDLDFFEILNVTLRMGDHYSTWQRRDCKRAKDQLMTTASSKHGLVPFADFNQLTKGDVKPLFTEEAEQLRYFGVMDDSQPENPHVMIPNFLNSKTMCLTTASYYMVCCPNECETLLDRLRDVGSPTLVPSKIKEVLGKEASRPGLENVWSELEGLASEPGGAVSLHGISFAQWLHKAFPMECPAPNPVQRAGSVLRDPKTVNEWLQPKSENNTDILRMGKEVAEKLKIWEIKDLENAEPNLLPVDDAPEPVLRIREPPIQDATPSLLSLLLACIRSMIFVVVLMSALGAAVFQFVSATQKDNEKQKKTWVGDSGSSV